MILSDFEKQVLSGSAGTLGDQMAMEIVVEAGKLLGAERLVEIVSSHIDGCLFHGASGTLFCEKLASEGALVKVPSTTNVGALNLLNPNQSKLSGEERKMAYRLMLAHEKMGCRPSWTCAPYQAGARPATGQQIAWGESNAVAFANTVLGARTNRYGDFLDISCAIAGRAPLYGLHLTERRRATIVFDLTELSPTLLAKSMVYPVIGALIGQRAGDAVPAIVGLPNDCSEDMLKALCAAAASTGAVALVHVVGRTPEAPDLETALGHQPAQETVRVTHDMILGARDRLSLAGAGPVDCVALGSPHFSTQECLDLLTLTGGQQFAVPVYVCLGRHVLTELEANGTYSALSHAGVEFVVDTCVVVTPILPQKSGILMTNSGKFAHYAMGNTGYLPVFGSLSDCVTSAVSGRVTRDESSWA